uniref:Uncharacterized protein n=1 Tax=Arundo donax TaxID=35708 RepID=A0A0A8ZSU4_ARUDO
MHRARDSLWQQSGAQKVRTAVCYLGRTVQKHT